MPASVQIVDDDVHNHPGITQIPDDDVHNHPSVDPDDPTPVVSATKIDTSDVPEYEQQAAQKVQLQPDTTVPKAIAYSTPTDTTHIEVDHPEMYTSGVQAHELQHMVQKNAGSRATGVSRQTSGEQGMYDYGGTEGLAKHLASGKTVSDLNPEQQASIPENYMKEYNKAVKSGDSKAIDRLNEVYQPAIKQLRNMANPSKTTIDTTPDAPAGAPAELLGSAKPVKGMASNSTKSATLPTQAAPAKTIKKPSWSAAAASGLGRRQ